MGNFLPRVIVDDFDKPSTASSNGDGCSVFEKRRGIEEAGFGRAGSAFSFHGSAFGFGCSRIFVRYECLGKELWAAMHRRPEWIGGRNSKLLLLQQVVRRMTAPIPY